MSQVIAFNFSINDPAGRTTTSVVPSSTNNYVAHSFLQIPIYNVAGVQIGYKVSDDYIQQIAANQFAVRISSTYFIQGQGTITWNASFVNTQPNFLYPVGTIVTSNIVSTSGTYLGRTGRVALLANADGSRNVLIFLN